MRPLGPISYRYSALASVVIIFIYLNLLFSVMKLSDFSPVSTGVFKSSQAQFIQPLCGLKNHDGSISSAIIQSGSSNMCMNHVKFRVLFNPG